MAQITVIGAAGYVGLAYAVAARLRKQRSNTHLPDYPASRRQRASRGQESVMAWLG